MDRHRRKGTKSYLSTLAQSLPSRGRHKIRNESVVASPYKGASEEEEIYFQCLKHGYLPSNHTRIFRKIYNKIQQNRTFAWKCLQFAIHSRNEEIVKNILQSIPVTRDTFTEINDQLYDRVIEEAVELDDLETILSILDWRTYMATNHGLSDVDRKLMRYQKRALTLMVSACIKNNYAVVNALYNDGYKLYQKSLNIKEEIVGGGQDMLMHIDNLRIFKALSSPAYIAVAYKKNPIEKSFEFTRTARRLKIAEPEFRQEYTDIQNKSRKFAVAILQNCQTSEEVEEILGMDNTCGSQTEGRIYQAIQENQKEFVAHSYSQLLLYCNWLNGSAWCQSSLPRRILHIILIILLSPICSTMYIFSPYRNHKNVKGPHIIVNILRVLDKPINRYILDMFSYSLFLMFLLNSVTHSLDENKLKSRTWYFWGSIIWVVAYTARDLHDIARMIYKNQNPLKFYYIFNIIMDLLFIVGIGLKFYGYEFCESRTFGGGKGSRTSRYRSDHPINVGANVYGLACCMAFLKVIFMFEIHYKFGPILYIIKNVLWDITTIIVFFIIALFAFGVGMVSIFGIYGDDNSEFGDFSKTLSHLFWTMFDPGQEDMIRVDRNFERHPPIRGRMAGPERSRHELLDRISCPWPYADADKSKNETQLISESMGTVVWGIYHVFVIVIMMNLLISLMTTTFTRIVINADTEWKFSRAATWITYFGDRNSLPIPFNIFPSVHFVTKIFQKMKKTKGLGLLAQEAANNPATLYDYEQLMERVFRNEAKMDDSHVVKSDLDNLEKEISIDFAELRRSINAVIEHFNDLIVDQLKLEEEEENENDGRKLGRAHDYGLYVPNSLLESKIKRLHKSLQELTSMNEDETEHKQAKRKSSQY